MRKIHTKHTKLNDGSVLVENVIVAHSLNLKTLSEKFCIREEGFLDLSREIECILSQPKIYRCNSTAIRNLVNAQKGETVFVVRQVHSEHFV